MNAKLSHPGIDGRSAMERISGSALESGLSQSTISNIFSRNTTPSIPTLESICKGFGITLAQFFAEGDWVELTPEQHKMFLAWSSLSSTQKKAISQLIDAMKEP